MLSLASVSVEELKCYMFLSRQVPDVRYKYSSLPWPSFAFISLYASFGNLFWVLSAFLFLSFGFLWSYARFFSSIQLYWKRLWPKHKWPFTEIEGNGSDWCWNGKFAFELKFNCSGLFNVKKQAQIEPFIFCLSGKWCYLWCDDITTMEIVRYHISFAVVWG